MRTALAVAGLAGLFMLTACGKEDAGSSAPATDSPTTTAAAADPSTLGPQGFGAVKLGASAADLTGAGLKVEDSAQGDKACPKVASIELPDGNFANVVISTKNGVSVIEATGPMHTPEGVKIGSTLDEVKKAYPQLKNLLGNENNGGANAAAVPGNPEASYQMFITNAKVTSLRLMLTNLDCTSYQ